MPTVPVQFTVPALVSGLYKNTVLFPVRFNTPLLATMRGPPELPPLQLIVAPPATSKLPVNPPPQLSTPVTVLLPPRMLPASVRLVIVPPWKPIPKITVPPPTVDLEQWCPAASGCRH